MSCGNCIRNEAERRARPDKIAGLEKSLADARAALSSYSNGTTDGGRRARQVLGIPELVYTYDEDDYLKDNEEEIKAAMSRISSAR